MSKQIRLPVEVLDWLAQELDKIVEDTVERTAKFFNIMQDIEHGDDDTKALADMVIDMHKKQLDRIDVQLIRWSTLKLTELQQEAVAYCQTQLQTLYQLQGLLEEGPPANMHLLQ